MRRGGEREIMKGGGNTPKIVRGVRAWKAGVPARPGKRSNKIGEAGCGPLLQDRRELPPCHHAEASLSLSLAALTFCPSPTEQLNCQGSARMLPAPAFFP